MSSFSTKPKSSSSISTALGQISGIDSLDDLVSQAPDSLAAPVGDFSPFGAGGA